MYLLLILVVLQLRGCLGVSGVSLGVSTYGDQVYAGEAVTATAYLPCATTCSTSILFTYAFGDGVEITTTNYSTSHIYSKGGWYTLTVTARDGSSSSTTTISLLLQPKRAWYTFQLFSMVDGEERYIPTLTLGQQLPLYARVVDPSDPSLSRSAHLSSLFSALGELPFVTWDYTVPYSPQPSETPLQLVFGVFNATKGVWQGTLTSLTDISGNYPAYSSLSGSLNSRGVGALGCSIRITPFSATVSRFPSSSPLASSANSNTGMGMIRANYNPASLRIARDACSVNTGIATIGSSQEGLGGLVITTDDSFGPSTTLVDLISASGEGSLCAAFPSATCSSIVVLDIKFVPGSDILLLLTSSGLAAASTNSSDGYKFTSITTGESAIDSGVDSSSVHLFTSYTCPSDSEMTGPNYAYLVHTSPEGILVHYTAFDDVTEGLASVSGSYDKLNEFIGPWTSYDIRNFTSSGRECVGVAWNSNSLLHTIVLSGTSLDPPIVLSCNTSCDVTFTFPIGTEVTGLASHLSGLDLLVYGNQIWYSSLSSPTYYKLTDLASGERAVSLATAAQRTAYAVLTDAGTVYYGRMGVRDSVVIPSPLSQLQGPKISNILFDAQGHLFSIHMDTPITLATFPIGMYLNSAGTLRSFTDPSVLHKTQLLVSATVSSSDYAYPSCPLSLQMEGTTAVFRQMKSGCSFETKLENRVLDLASGGSVMLRKVINNTLVMGTITSSLVPLTLSTSLANASLSFYTSNDGSCAVSVVADHSSFTSSDVMSTITYRLDSVYLSTFVDSTRMQGTSLSCLGGVNDQIARATNSSRLVILTGAGIFTYPDGPTPDGLGWIVPGGEWNMYDVSSPAKYRITARCPYRTLTFNSSSDAAIPVLYLDVGDVGNAYAQVAPVGSQLEVYTSGSKSVITNVENSINYVSANGLQTSNISFLFQEGQQKGGVTLLLRARMPSLVCDSASAAIRIVHGCPPTKTLQLIRPYSFDQFTSSHIPKYPISGWPMLVELHSNYRPPSPLGKAIPTTDNIYNADPSKPRSRDVFRISKSTGKYKQCIGKESRSDCECTDLQRFNGLVKDSDCIDKVFAYSWREGFLPQFTIVNDGVTQPVLADYTLTELNGRTDYCFNVSDMDCKSPDVESYVIRGDAYVGIRFLGSELYHFRVKVVNYHNLTSPSLLTSFCPLHTEIAIWAYNPPLSQTSAWITVSLTAFVIVMVLFGAFLLYSYLYSSDTTT